MKSSPASSNQKTTASPKQMAMAKTFLTILPTFSKYLNALDKEILNKAQYSYYGYRDTYNQIARICDLIGCRDKLHFIKERIEVTLSRAPNRHEKVIYMYFKHRLKTSRMAVILGVSQRSIFRYIAAALNWFAMRIDEIINLQSFTELLHAQPWLRHMYSRMK